MDLQTRLIGREAMRLLAGPADSGRVLAVVSQTIYLSGRGDEVLWMAIEEVPLHRRCLQAPLPDGDLAPGQNFWVEDSCLHLGRNMRIRLDRAIPWEPRIIGPGEALPPAVLKARFQGLLGTIVKQESADRWGTTIPWLAALIHGRGLSGLASDFLVAHAQPTLLALIEACLDRDAAQIAKRGRELVGFGPGLTPAGDDFLGGLLFAFHHLRKAYPGDFSLDAEPLTELIGWAQTRTPSISHALLQDFALGQGPEPLHEIMISLLKGDDLQGLMAGVERMLSFGHSSGGEILAGLMAGMLAAVGKRR